MDVQTFLMGMTLAAIREKRLDDAQYYADKYERLTREFEVMDCTAHAAQLETAMYRQDRQMCLSLYKDALHSIQKCWQIDQSPLYKHLDIPESKTKIYSQDLQTAIIREMGTEKGLAFLREDPEYKDLMAKYKNSIEKTDEDHIGNGGI